MSIQDVQSLCDDFVFQPRSKFAYLALDHVSLDDLTGRPNYETRALRAVTSEPACAAIIGPVGAGKSSLIAHVCDQLPATHIALRVPIVGVDDPTSTSAMAALALSTALNSIALEANQRDALGEARAGRMTVERQAKSAGGMLGGGPVPMEVHTELGTLRTQVETNALAGDRLAGLDRLVSILETQGLEPIFVLEDTEAAVGGGDRVEVVDAFFSGPVTAFVREVDAACLLAVQDHIAAQEPFLRLAPSLRCVELPRFDQSEAESALSKILAHRLSMHKRDFELSDVLDGSALRLLANFYAETGGLRHTLAAAQTAADHAADNGAEIIADGHVKAAVNEWAGGRASG